MPSKIQLISTVHSLLLCELFFFCKQQQNKASEKNGKFIADEKLSAYTLFNDVLTRWCHFMSAKL